MQKADCSNAGVIGTTLYNKMSREMHVVKKNTVLKLISSPFCHNNSQEKIKDKAYQHDPRCHNTCKYRNQSGLQYLAENDHLRS